LSSVRNPNFDFCPKLQKKVLVKTMTEHAALASFVGKRQVWSAGKPFGWGFRTEADRDVRRATVGGTTDHQLTGEFTGKAICYPQSYPSASEDTW